MNENDNLNEKIKVIPNLNLKKKRISIHDSKRNIQNLAGSTLCCLRGGNIDINNEIDCINNELNDKNESGNSKSLNSDDSFPSLNLNNNINFEKNELSPINSTNRQDQMKIASLNLNKDEPKEINNNIKEDFKQNNNANNNINRPNNMVNNELNDKTNMKIRKIRSQDNQALHYGILSILGLFCLKSLFSSNNFFSADCFLNIVILGLIGFIMYKTQFK